MTTLAEIRTFPRSLTKERMQRDEAEDGYTTGWHESNLRAWHIVAKVKDLLRRGCPADVILEIIEDLE